MQYVSLMMKSGYDKRVEVNLNHDGYRVMEGFYINSGNEGLLTDKIDVYLVCDTEENLINRVRAVELALDFAKAHPSGPDGVWLYYSPDTDTLDPWRSRIVGGAVLHNADFQRRLDIYEIQIEVVIERVAYFETVTAVDLTVDVGGGSSIYNHTDGAHQAWGSISASQVIGTLPAPAIIEVENNSNDGKSIDNLYIGHFAQSVPIGLPEYQTLVLEGSGTADGDCSGGEYKPCPWLGITENQLANWSLPTETLLQRYFKAAARFKAGFAYTDLYLQMRILYGNLVLAQTRWQLMEANRELQLIGSMRIPPFKHGTYIDLGNLSLALYEKRAGGNGQIDLDYVALMPQDSWRKFTSIANLEYGYALIDNPVDDIIIKTFGASYTYGASYINADISHILEAGGPIMLQPGVINNLTFLHDCTDGTAPIARVSDIRISYHPRRRTI